MEQIQRCSAGKGRVSPGNVAVALIAHGKSGYGQLKNRYGPRYAKGMMAAACFTLFVPLPGISLLAVALVVAVAEAHRAISRRDRPRRTRPKAIKQIRQQQEVLGIKSFTQ